MVSRTESKMLNVKKDLNSEVKVKILVKDFSGDPSI